MPEIALAGNPNTGKTTLFNSLTGASARVGNYPGITVEKRIGQRVVDGATWTLHDLPGCYSLTALSPEEEVAHHALTGAWGDRRPDCVIVVLDASNLARNLMLLLQIRELGLRVVAALNLTDQAEAMGLRLDVPALAAALQTPMVPMVARRGEGIEALEQAVQAALAAPAPAPLALVAWPEPVERAITALQRAGGAGGPGSPGGLPDLSNPGDTLWWLCSEDAALQTIAADGPAWVEQATGLDRAQRRALRRQIAETRYQAIDALLAKVLAREPARASWSDRVDRVALHAWAGPLLFLLVMGLLFQAVFAGVDPVVDAIDGAMGAVGEAVGKVLPDGMLRQVVVDGVIAGVAGTLVFVPQIAVLFLGISVLEDSGYLARAALMVDRTLGRAGLPGTAFVPLLSSFACNVPGILAARTMASPADRLVTILIAPLMSCAARLPVYALVTAAVFAGTPKIGGVLAVGGLLIFAMYALGLLLAVILGAVLRKTVARGERSPLLLELPPYRLPRPRDVGLAVWRRVWQFTTETGSVIVALTVVLWALMTFPQVELPGSEREPLERAVAAATAPEDRAAAEARLAGRRDAYQLEQSAAGWIGKAVEPAIAPLGFDWRIGIGIVGSFAAREVLIPVLGRVYGRGADADDEDAYRDEVGHSLVRVSGMTPLVGVALMVFFAVAMQCMSTVAVIARETRSLRWPLASLVLLNALAWVLAFASRQVGLALGWS